MCVITRIPSGTFYEVDEEDVGVLHSICSGCMERVESILGVQEEVERLQGKLKWMVEELREIIGKKLMMKESVPLSFLGGDWGGGEDIKGEEMEEDVQVQTQLNADLDLISKIHSYARTTPTIPTTGDDIVGGSNVLISDNCDNPEESTVKPPKKSSSSTLRLKPNPHRIQKQKPRFRKTNNPHIQQCPHCPKRLKDAISLNGHIHRVHEGDELTPFHCTATDPTPCTKKFRNSTELKIHLYSHTSDKRFECDQCGKGFLRKQSYLDHTREAHPPMTEEGEGGFYCDQPDCEGVGGVKFKCPTLSGLVRHRCQKHGAVWPVKCDVCGKGFATKYGLKGHSFLHKEGAEKPTYPCTLCDKAYPSRTYLKEHTLARHEGRRWECGVCGKEYMKLAVLRKHELCHKEGVEKLKCQICGKEFFTRHAHDKHQICHGEKMWECTYCPWKFAHKNKWQLHMKLHQGIKDHMCDQCGKCFVNIYRLRMHRRVHESGGRVQRPTMGSLERETKGVVPYNVVVYQEGKDEQQGIDQEGNINIVSSVKAPGSSVPPLPPPEGDIVALALKGLEQDLENSEQVGDGEVPSTSSATPTSTSVPNKLMLKCPRKNCCRVFHSVGAMRGHILGRHDGQPTPYHCNQCEDKFETFVLLRSHFLSIHKELLPVEREPKKKNPPVNKIYTCSHCIPQVSFKTLKTLTRHMLVAHPDLAEGLAWPSTCSNCGKGFMFERELRRHEKAMHSDIPKVCTIPGCGLQFESKKLLAYHQRSMHGRGYSTFVTSKGVWKCKECNEEFRSKQRMRTHVRRTHMDPTVAAGPVRKTSLVCTECVPEVYFRGENARRRHMIRKHDQGAWPTTCDECGKGFLNEMELRAHQDNSHGEMLRCPYAGCRVEFQTRRSLPMHKTKTHGKRFNCTWCSRGFGDMKTLKRHMINSHDQKGARATGRSGSPRGGRGPTSPSRVSKRVGLSHGGKRGPSSSRS